MNPVYSYTPHNELKTWLPWNSARISAKRKMDEKQTTIQHRAYIPGKNTFIPVFKTLKSMRKNITIRKIIYNLKISCTYICFNLI